jgi:isohexenylglutaconyl-CoA hydratase
VLGGGFRFTCVSDVAIATETAQFGMPETSLGVIPAQIAPFVVQRIGMTQARRLALLGARFNGAKRRTSRHRASDSGGRNRSGIRPADVLARSQKMRTRR